MCFNGEEVELVCLVESLFGGFSAGWFIRCYVCLSELRVEVCFKRQGSAGYKHSFSSCSCWHTTIVNCTIALFANHLSVKAQCVCVCRPAHLRSNHKYNCVIQNAKMFRNVLFVSCLKDSSPEKWNFCHLLTLRLFQICFSLFFWTQKMTFWRMLVNKLVPIDFHSIPPPHTVEANGCHQLFGYKRSSEYLHLCSTEERHSYRFGRTWGGVNDDNFHFWVNCSFNITVHFYMLSHAVLQANVSCVNSGVCIITAI